MSVIYNNDLHTRLRSSIDNFSTYSSQGKYYNNRNINAFIIARFTPETAQYIKNIIGYYPDLRLIEISGNIKIIKV